MTAKEYLRATALPPVVGKGGKMGQVIEKLVKAGKMSGKRALVVDHDLRIIFTERNNCQDVTLLDVGGHADVYRH